MINYGRNMTDEQKEQIKSDIKKLITLYENEMVSFDERIRKLNSIISLLDHASKKNTHDCLEKEEVTEEYVSFKVATLLKKAGFDEPCQMYYYDGSTLYFHDCTNSKNMTDDKAATCPTLQRAIKWLRVKHNIHIEIRYNVYGNNYYYEIIHNPIILDRIRSYPVIFYSHEVAGNAALENVLNRFNFKHN